MEEGKLIYVCRVETILRHIKEMIINGDTTRNQLIGIIENYIDSLDDHDDGKEMTWKREESLSQEVETIKTTEE